MNCKPGDLARIVCAASPNRDRIVRCIRLLQCGEEMVLDGVIFAPTIHAEFWAVEGCLLGADPCGKDIEIDGGPVGDRWLRPIRDPGEDAKDESHAWLPPVPTFTKERETA